MNTLPCLIAMATLCAALTPTLAHASEPEAKKEHGDASAAETPAPSGPSDRYVHKWIPFPSAAGASLPGADSQSKIEAKPGRLTVVIFLASWCEPCQQLMPSMRKLEKRYQRLPRAVDVHYVFVHDTLDDASGFMKEFGVNQAILGNGEISKTFHNPDLPSIYVGDRHGWLMTRYIKAAPSAVDQLDDLLKYLAAY